MGLRPLGVGFWDRVFLRCVCMWSGVCPWSLARPSLLGCQGLGSPQNSSCELSLRSHPPQTETESRQPRGTCTVSSPPRARHSAGCDVGFTGLLGLTRVSGLLTGRNQRSCGLRVGLLWALEVGLHHSHWGQVTDLLPVTYATNLHVCPPTRPAVSEHGLFLVLWGCDKQLPVLTSVKGHLHPCWPPAQRTVWGPSPSRVSSPFSTTASFSAHTHFRELSLHPCKGNY